MGTCASAHKNSDSTMKFPFSIDSKTDKLLIPSESNEKTVNGTQPMTGFGFKTQSSPIRPVKSFRDFGSKEETFFDSQPWLDSDCEDDFFSVNGDFTPSRGNTPIHLSSYLGTPQRKITPFGDRTPDSKSSPTDKKKKLAELFQEVDDHNNEGIQNMANEKLAPKQTILDVLPKSTNGTPYISGANSCCSSERTPNRDSKPEREKAARASQCCLPSLVSSLSFNERKKKPTPVSNGGG